MAETTKPKEPQVKEPQETVVSEMGLPTLMGVVVRRVLAALQTGDAALKQAILSQSRNDLASWYQEQKPENRVEFAKQQRKVMDNFKLLGEQFASDMAQLTAADMSAG